jgi:hypothetical protein
MTTRMWMATAAVATAAAMLAACNKTEEKPPVEAVAIAETATSSADCPAAGKVSYLCGPANAEDLVLAPDTSWMVVSGMAGPQGGAGKLYLIDAAKKTWKGVEPAMGGAARAPYDKCAAPDIAKFAAHGLALRPGAGGRHTVYAINHGGRESIEVMELDANAAEPTLTWIGCIEAPKGASLNSVAPAPDGRLVASKFNELGDKDAFAKMADLKKTGLVYEWSPAGGWKPIPGTEMSGANGVAVSADGKWLFVNAWPEKKVNRFPIAGGKPETISVDFLPDNLRWAPDGQLLVAGQAAGDMKALMAAACGKPRCPHAWTVLKLDPATMKTTPVLHEEGADAFSDATGALQVGDEIWVGTFRGDRLAYAKVE